MSEADRERWNERFRDQRRMSDPSTYLVSLDEVLPRSGRALDVAGGAGRHALWLAARGLDVTLADVSDVALAKAASAARERGLPLRTVRIDLEEAPLPKGPWDVILCFNFLLRPLYPAFVRALAPGGCLVVQHPTKTNLEANDRPPSDRLLADGELPSLVAGLEILRYEEAWFEEDAGRRHEARLIARAPSATAPKGR